MPGIYLHIPFCKQACHYCDFHFSTSLKNKAGFLKALKREIALQKNYLNQQLVSTIYFGGGTPSMLSGNEITGIFEEIQRFHRIAADAEITLEANSDDLSPEKINALKDSPVNRLSIGVQSFHDRDLQYMNRAHNVKQAYTAIVNSREAGFDQLSIDLIYGIPGLSDNDWRMNMETACSLNIAHISSYCLTIEPGTALAHFIKTGKAKAVDEEQASRQFEQMIALLKENDYEHYEISSFCRPACYSRHNSSYWKNEHYLGLGPSAHSFNGTSRQWNISNNSLYIRSLEQDAIPSEIEILSLPTRFNEYLLTGLRTMWGCDLEHIATAFGAAYREHLLMEAEAYLKNNWLLKTNNTLTLTPAGKLMADKIAADLFVAE